MNRIAKNELKIAADTELIIEPDSEGFYILDLDIKFDSNCNFNFISSTPLDVECYVSKNEIENVSLILLLTSKLSKSYNVTNGSILGILEYEGV